MKCFICHSEGYFERDCLVRKSRNLDDEGSSYGGNASVVSGEYDRSNIPAVSTTKSRGKWVMDSGFPFHIFPTKEWFQSLNEKEVGMVLLGNNYECKIKGIGTMKLLLSDDTSNHGFKLLF